MTCLLFAYLHVLLHATTSQPLQRSCIFASKFYFIFYIHIFRIGLAEFCLKRTMHPTCQLSCTSGIVLESGNRGPQPGKSSLNSFFCNCSAKRHTVSLNIFITVQLCLLHISFAVQLCLIPYIFIASQLCLITYYCRLALFSYIYLLQTSSV